MTALATAFAATGERVRLVPEDGPTLAVERLADGVRVGRLTLAAVGETLEVRCLVIDDARRGYGAGSEAANLLVRSAEGAGWRHIRAWAHPSLGLSVYFWMRMGFRPLHGAGPEGGIWFERGAPGG